MALLSTLFRGPLRPMLSRPSVKPGLYVATGPRVLPDWALRAQGRDPKRVLSGVRLARPFNAYQMETMARTKLPKLFWGQPIVLSDPLAPLYDEDLPLSEARSALEETLAALTGLPTAILVLLPDRAAPAGREMYLERFLSRARAVSRLAPVSRGRFALTPWDGAMVPALACA